MSKVGIFVLLACFELVALKSLDEPQCSPYDFFERTIEKVVRVESASENFKEKMREMKTSIGEKLKVIDQVLRGKLKEFQREITEIKEHFAVAFEIQNAKIEELVTKENYAGAKNLTRCQDGWIPFKGSCYFFGYERPMTFTDTMIFCRSLGSEIVYVNDSYQNQFLKGFMKRLKPFHHWLGITDAVTEGDWRWIHNNDALTFTDWSPGQPNTGSHGDKEDCAVFTEPTFEWHDTTCSLKWQPLCEKNGF